MALKNISPTSTKTWSLLAAHQEKIKDSNIQEFFTTDKNRVSKYQIKKEGFLLDYSKNLLDDTAKNLLIQLAEECQLKEAIEAAFNGELINQTEGRAVLHTALRNPNTSVSVNNKGVKTKIQKNLKKMKAFTKAILSGKKTGYTDKPIDTVVNIGIGGSDLGPKFVLDAMHFYKSRLQTHFISNVDGDATLDLLESLDRETTLFIITSKTFSTQETITNANTVKNWFLEKASVFDMEKHFAAVSVNVDSANSYGISKENIFPMWDWVGGRFSLCSSVGLIISLGIGYANFEKLLSGAHQMDTHFREQPFEENMPVMLALISIWYNNFFGAETEAILPYTEYLKKLVPYLQQAMMESNGKNVDRSGNPIPYQTGTIVWGEPGTNAQHSFFQLFHQGTKRIPADFIGFIESLHGNKEHHDKLMANFFAQIEAFLKGQSYEELLASGIEESIAKHKVIPGNRPTNTLLLQKLSPESLGEIISLYEHKIFVQGILWNVFSYDQMGVELGKKLGKEILNEITDPNATLAHDASSNALITSYKKGQL